MTGHRPDSPDLLAAAGPAAREGVRRLNRVPFMIAHGRSLPSLLGPISYTYWQRLQQANAAKDRSDSKALAFSLMRLTGASSRPRRPRPFQRRPPPPPRLPPAPELPKAIPISMSGKSSLQRLARMRQAREQLNIAALDAPSSVKASLPKPAAATSEIWAIVARRLRIGHRSVHEIRDGSPRADGRQRRRLEPSKGQSGVHRRAGPQRRKPEHSSSRPRGAKIGL